MNITELIVTLGGLGIIGFLAWYFFGPKQSSAAQVKGHVQEIVVTVKGGYSPDVIRVKKDVPLRLIFDRKEAGDCSSRVVFPDFRASKTLSPFAKTTLEFTPDKVGQFGFACGMNMLHGTLIVDEDGAKAGETSETIEVTPSSSAQEHIQEHEHVHAEAVGVGPKLPVTGTSQVEFALIGRGVTCPTCAVNIETALGSFPGVDDVKVNFGIERITVSYDPEQITPEKMQEIIENTGYKRSRRAIRRAKRPHPARRYRSDSHYTGGFCRNDTRVFQSGVVAGVPYQSLAATGTYRPRDVICRLADTSYRLANVAPSHCRYEHADYNRHYCRLCL
jgi:Cu+-exporting ATPase